MAFALRFRPLLRPTRAFVAPRAVRFRSNYPGRRMFSNERDAEVIGESPIPTPTPTPSEPIPSTPSTPSSPPPSTPSPKGPATTQAFQAETRQLLDIVAKSIYTDKEVFLRELISNASDALEKARFHQSSGKVLESDRQLEVRIYTDEKANTITIQDSGVGMNEAELISNLGTIARSGSREFLKKLTESGSSGASNIIGQFGVGFYSTFMVADKVEVFSQSAILQDDGKAAPAHYWVSDGSGVFSLSEAENVTRGTKIIIHLKSTQKEYAASHVVEGVIKKYSNFVGYPVYLNDTKLNILGAIWLHDKDTVSDEQHKEFYRHIAAAYDEPAYRLHFKTDIPLSINALFYFPQRHMEKFGMSRMEPGVSLYSRKVLIQPKSKQLLPEWMRWIKGVVDSEDIPLNISRENMQDSRTISRIRNVLTKRVLKFLEDQMKKDITSYRAWFAEFGSFVKEGVCTDTNNKNEIAKLLLFESSQDHSTLYTLDEYISRMRPDQKAIYYLDAPRRELALQSPYYEPFQKQGIEVLFFTQPVDTIVATNMGEFAGRKLISVQKAEAGEEKSGAKADQKQESAPSAAAASLCDWVQKTLSDKVDQVKVTRRNLSVPLIVIDHEGGQLRKMIKMMDPSQQMMQREAKFKLEINPDHLVMRRLLTFKDTDPRLAKLVLEQAFDNGLIAADVLDEPRSMLPRLNTILARLLDTRGGAAAAAAAVAESGIPAAAAAATPDAAAPDGAASSGSKSS